jgi:XTP/dITP diphosphohydrolase
MTPSASASVVVVASANPGKVAELATALKPAGIDAVGLEALRDATPVEETGATFEDNARLKACAYSQRTELPVVADDSGLEVDALGGGPGVLSARYGSPHLSDVARCRALLKALVDVPEPKRTARFRCVLAVARRGQALATFEGAVEGTILRKPVGKNGFGYDPIFFHPGAGRSFAQLTLEEKQALSHRGAAIERLLQAVRAGRLDLGLGLSLGPGGRLG